MTGLPIQSQTIDRKEVIMSSETPAPENAAPETPAQAERRRVVEDAVHSGEMEGLSVTPAFDEDAAAYVNGTITLEEFGSRVRSRNSRG